MNQVRINDVRIELDPSQKFVETKNGDDFFIHTVSIKADESTKRDTLKKSKIKLKLSDEQCNKNRRLLFIPGFGASASAYCFLWKELSCYFDITTVDMMGFGCSGRPRYKAFELE